MIVKYSFLPFLPIGYYTPTVTFSPHSKMHLHFVAAVDERVNRDFTAPSSVWGVAFKGQGDYPAA